MELTKILFAAHLKNSSFQPNDDIKPMLNYLVRAVPWHNMFAVSMIMQWSLLLLLKIIMTKPTIDIKRKG
jgi:hypothetical protein